ncbi:hypothetical protein KW791_00725 [Candidatus Parcubacteria bacterium]|nr:hypothetical protein [Candidatus Parcubacteria bacterium]
MFRRISSQIGKKKSALSKEYSNKTTIEESIKQYLISEYGNIINQFPIEVKYQESSQLLTLNASSKTIANELVLKSRTIAELLKKSGYLVSKIIIR